MDKEKINWELKNLDSLKDYIFNELIGSNDNAKDINEAINTYAERYHEMKLKLLGLNKTKLLQNNNYEKIYKILNHNNFYFCFYDFNFLLCKRQL